MCLHCTEDAVLMLEVQPPANGQGNIGQVVLKRLMSADQALEHLADAMPILPSLPVPVGVAV